MLHDDWLELSNVYIAEYISRTTFACWNKQMTFILKSTLNRGLFMFCLMSGNSPCTIQQSTSKVGFTHGKSTCLNPGPRINLFPAISWSISAGRNPRLIFKGPIKWIQHVGRHKPKINSIFSVWWPCRSEEACIYRQVKKFHRHPFVVHLMLCLWLTQSWSSNNREGFGKVSHPIQLGQNLLVLPNFGTKLFSSVIKKCQIEVWKRDTTLY